MVQVGVVTSLGLLAFACSLPEAQRQTAAFSSSAITVASTEAFGAPTQGRYTFYHSWHWDYENTWIPADEYGRTGQLTAYHDDSTGAWLFTAEAYGGTDEMADWVLALPTGEYITGYRDETGNRNLLRDTLDFPESEEVLAEWLQPTGEKQVFGENHYGWPTLQASAYAVNYQQTKERSKVWLADTAVDMRPLVYFNRRIADAKLPVHFMPDLAIGKIEVAADTESGAQRIHHRLTAISDNYYEINLEDYEKQREGAGKR